MSFLGAPITMISVAATLRLLDDRGACVARRAGGAGSTLTPYESPIARASSSSRLATSSSSGVSGAERELERDLDHVHGDDLRAALGREPGGDVERVVGGLARNDGDEQPPVLERERRAIGGRARAPSPRSARARPAGGRAM